ncbi:hypothetical protein ACFL2X_05195 [Candidatus Latescibacterota bacterium]
MKLIRLLTVSLALAVMLSSCAGIMNMKKSKGLTVAGVLKDAKVPLSAEKEKQLTEFKIGDDREAFMTFYQIFDEKQIEVLKETFGSSPGFGGGPERPRWVFFAVLFENENCPLTMEQLTALNELPTGRDGFGRMNEVLNEEQSALLQNMFNR